MSNPPEEITSAWDFESRVDYVDAELTDAVNALQLLYESLKREGYQDPDKIVEWRAINFIQRFSYYLSTLYLIKAALQDCEEQLTAAINKQNEARRNHNV